MLRFTILLVFLYVLLAISETVSKPACGPVCDIFCPYGNVIDENGCPTCKCKPKPCGPVCDIFCEYGNIIDENGCPTCKCKPSPCKNGLAPLVGYFCGHGPNRKDCPAAYECVIAPNDAYAVCCPRRGWITGNI